MRWVQINVARSLYADLPRRPTAVGTYVVNTPPGATVQSSAAPSLDAVNTTLSGAAVLGATSLSVVDGTGIVVGRRYLLGGAETLGGEVVTVRAYAANVVTIVRPLRAAQPSGATLQGTRLTFAVSALATPLRNMRIEWTPASADADLALVLPFDALRYAPVTYLTTEDLRDLDPLLAKRLSAGTWLHAVAAKAWDVLVGHITQRIDPGGVAGTVDLTLAHSYLVRALLAETVGKDTEAVSYLEDMRARYAQERDNALGALSYDPAQSGNATARVGWSKSLRLVRG